MIGTTNVISKKNEVERINLVLNTNQASHGDLVGIAFTVQYGTYTKNYNWDGNAVIIEIPAYVEYTITFNEVSGYATPSVLTCTAISGNAKSVNAVYKTELVSVTVNADNGESVNEQIVTINGVKHTWKGTKITQKIPFGTSYSVSVNDKEDYVTPQIQSFTASVAKRDVIMQYAEIPVTDLSRRDIHGNPIDQNTANCYIIKQTGKYKFPIAYGAAIKNGEVNAVSYTNNGGENSHDFVNYLGNVITSPYVETDTATQAAEVQISIADVDAVLSDLQIVDGENCRYVQFKVDDVPTVGGNLVLSVKDASGVIMWSWHIWLWEDDLTPVEITNATNVKYQILPVNLASKWDEESKEHIKNWFYQWGRPNPILCPSAYDSDIDHETCGALSFTKDDCASNIQVGIQNPQTFYYNQSHPNNWFGAYLFYNLWDANRTTTGNSDKTTAKTVYDPCPIGFKIPGGNTFTYFSTSNAVGVFNNGLYLKRNANDAMGVFFPASGYRPGSSGELHNVGRIGSAWLSSMDTFRSAYCLFINSSSVVPQNGFSYSNSGSVRPVQDTDLSLPTHKLTINVSADKGTLSGFEVKVYSVTKSIDETTGEVTETLGDVLATQTTASATHELVWGTEYKILCGDVASYITPESQSYTADVEYRTVSLEFVYRPGTNNPSNGVYIQDIEGFCYTEAEWTDEYVPNGVAVITDNCRFVIALEDAYSSTRQWGGYGMTVSGITTTTSEWDARDDYDGKAQTTTIINTLKGTNDGYVDGAPAAEYCRAYTFPNGSTGYLGAAGEWQAALDNKTAIKSALSKCGGDSIGNYNWTSTQCDSNRSWCMVWSGGYLFIDSKYNKDHVRAFAAI